MSVEKPTYKELEEKIAELESQLNYFSRDRVNRQAKKLCVSGFVFETGILPSNL